MTEKEPSNPISYEEFNKYAEAARDMTTYTIKPIEWRKCENSGIFTERERLPIPFLSYPEVHLYKDRYEATYYFNDEVDGDTKSFPTLGEAKSFIETSYREFVEQFLEKQ